MTTHTIEPGARVTADSIRFYPHRRVIERTGNSTAVTRLLVSDTEPRQWVMIQNHVGGWTCIATGEAAPGWSPEAVAEHVAIRYGNGFEHLSRDRFGLVGETATIIHIRRDTPAMIGAYCGIGITRPYDPDAPHPYKRYMQYCVDCTRIYRAENFGRCPLKH